MKYNCVSCESLFNRDGRKPKKLPCGHKTCHICLQDLMDDTEPVCPVCETEITVIDFPVDFDLLVELEEKDEDVIVLYCDLHPDKEAKGECSCGFIVCDLCNRVHQRNGHEVYDIGRAPLKCKEHNQPFLCVCPDHQILICPSCCIVTHKGCGDYIPIADEFVQTDQVVRDALEGLVMKLSVITDMEKEVRKMLKTVNFEKEQTVANIMDYFDDLRVAIDERQEQLIADLIVRAGDQKNLLTRQLNGLEDASVVAQQSIADINAVLVLNSATHLIDDREKLVALAEDLEVPEAEPAGEEFMHFTMDEGLVETLRMACNIE